MVEDISHEGKRVKSRRSVLRRIGMGGIAMSGISGIAAGKNPPDEADVSINGGESNRELLGKCISSPETTLLLRYSRNDNWKPQISDSKIITVANQPQIGSRYHLVILPLIQRGVNETASSRTLIWTDATEEAPHETVIQETTANRECRYFR